MYKLTTMAVNDCVYYGDATELFSNSNIFSSFQLVHLCWVSASFCWYIAYWHILGGSLYYQIFSCLPSCKTFYISISWIPPKRKHDRLIVTVDTPIIFLGGQSVLSMTIVSSEGYSFILFSLISFLIFVLIKSVEVVCFVGKILFSLSFLPLSLSGI